MLCGYKLILSPISQLTLVARNGKLSSVLRETECANRLHLGELQANTDSPVLLEAEYQSWEYFAGTRNQFEIELDFSGTAFQKKSGRLC